MSEKVIRDSIHGDIYLKDPVVVELIDTPEFQRLRRVSQLAGVQFAYPGATHTRFSHCLGVYYIVGEFLKNPDLAQKLTTKEKLLVQIAGLLHDVGHGPFSHSFEWITNKSHEDYSAALITNQDGNIAKILKKYKINPEEVASIIAGTYKNEYVSLLVSSQIDADRLDYLMRDAYYTGVNYASIDVSFFVRNLKIIDGKISYSTKAIYAIESYLLGRYYMFQQVYSHKISLGFDAVLVNWANRIKDLLKQNFQFNNSQFNYFFAEITSENGLSLNKYLELDDAKMYELFKLSILENDLILQDLANRLLERKFFKVANANQVKKTDLTKQLNQIGLDPTYYLTEFDYNWYIIYKEGKIDGKDETIYLFDKVQLHPLSKLTIVEKSMTAINNSKNKKYFLFGQK